MENCYFTVYMTSKWQDDIDVYILKKLIGEPQNSIRCRSAAHTPYSLTLQQWG